MFYVVSLTSMITARTLVCLWRYTKVIVWLCRPQLALDLDLATVTDRLIISLMDKLAWYVYYPCSHIVLPPEFDFEKLLDTEKIVETKRRIF